MTTAITLLFGFLTGILYACCVIAYKAKEHAKPREFIVNPKQKERSLGCWSDENKGSQQHIFLSPEATRCACGKKKKVGIS